MKIVLIVAALAPALGLVASAQTFGYNKPSLDRYGKPLPPRPYRAPDVPLGTGLYKAIMSEMPGLSAHVAYYPANLAALGDKKMPIVSWGNGGCVYAGNRFRDLLTEIASYGYLVVSGGPMADASMETGPNGPNPPVAPPGTQTTPRAEAVGGDASSSQYKVTEAMLREAIDWAIKQNDDSASRFYKKLDTAHIAVMGQSCGGILAENIGASDPRVTAVGIWNSGMFLGSDKSQLAKIHVPVLLLTGDSTHDIAYVNGKDDFDYFVNAPIYYAWKNGLDHIGTFAEPNGGELGKIAPAWLDWQFRGDPTAAKMFQGPDCALCKDPAWHIATKNNIH